MPFVRWTELRWFIFYFANRRTVTVRGGFGGQRFEESTKCKSCGYEVQQCG